MTTDALAPWTDSTGEVRAAITVLQVEWSGVPGPSISRALSREDGMRAGEPHPSVHPLDAFLH